MKKHLITTVTLLLLIGAVVWVAALRSDPGLPAQSVCREMECCTHPGWADAACTECGWRCFHREWTAGACSRCGEPCPHEQWTPEGCALCGEPCPHDRFDPVAHSCALCGLEMAHDYVGYRCRICGEPLEFETGYLGWELFGGNARAGTVETLTYETPDYYSIAHNVENDARWEKAVSVYLPYGYDESKQYDVLVLLHGMGGTEEYWLLGAQEYFGPGTNEVRTKEMLDNMIAWGLCKEMIVVTPTFYKDSSSRQNYDRQIDQTRFAGELRNQIMPLIAETYSTYAADGSYESLVAAREHFAFAGLSMGSIYGYNAILPQQIDMFAWFGLFAGSECNTVRVANALNKPENLGYPISFLYNAAGTRDDMGPPHKAQYRELLEKCPQLLVEGENAAFTDIEGAYHEYRAWGTGLYNFLRILFY